MKQVILALTTVMLVVACSESESPTSPSKQTGQTSSQYQATTMTSSSSTPGNGISINGISYGTYAYDGGTVVNIVSLSDGTTYTMASSVHCPSGWHKMTYDECTKLHQYGSDLDPAVFLDPFNVNKIFCTYSRGYSCEFYATGHCSEKGVTSTEGQSKDKLSNTRCVKGELSFSSSSFDSFIDTCAVIQQGCTYFTTYSTGGCRCEDDVKFLSSSSYIETSNLSYGEIIDSRDGKKYKTVQIGKQIWMAENLNYAVEKESFCYDNEESNCTKYGRLYTWNIAIDVCLRSLGWRLPSKEDFEILIDYVGGKSVFSEKLRSTYGWTTNNGDDIFGFSALPAGYYAGVRGEYENLGYETTFWTETVDGSRSTWGYNLDLRQKNSGALSSINSGSKSNGYSVRCIKE